VERIGRNEVVRVYEAGRTEERVITTGLSDEAYLQVLAGLDEGEVILID
jgi:hypothetical protein